MIHRDIIDLHTKSPMTRREARQTLKDRGELYRVRSVPAKYWGLLPIWRRPPDQSGSSLHVYDEVYRYGRGRSVHVYYIISTDGNEPDEVEIRTEEAVDG